MHSVTKRSPQGDVRCLIDFSDLKNTSPNRFFLSSWLSKSLRSHWGKYGITCHWEISSKLLLSSMDTGKIMYFCCNSSILFDFIASTWCGDICQPCNWWVAGITYQHSGLSIYVALQNRLEDLIEVIIHNQLKSIYCCPSTITTSKLYKSIPYTISADSSETKPIFMQLRDAVRSVRFMQRWVAWAGHRLVGSSYLTFGFLTFVALAHGEFEQNTIHTRVQAPRCCCCFYY